MRKDPCAISSSPLEERKGAFPSSLSLFSPAKLNLFFRVLHKREDGFHEIASLYQAISLGDTLTFCLADEDQLTCSDPSLAVDSTNLVWQALDLYRKQTGRRFSLHIHIDKKIPIQAGLGGGSSNAATVLWGLNSLSPQPISEEVLKGWSGTLSSDAPFFFSSGTAYCRGRGEQIESQKALSRQQLWVAKPKEGLSTPLVYQHCRPDQFQSRDPDQVLLEQLSGRPGYFNDLEEPAFALMPQLALLKKKLEELGFSHVTMTGSGTAFFCFGHCNHPTLPGVDFYPVSFISRSREAWYEFPDV